MRLQRLSKHTQRLDSKEHLASWFARPRRGEPTFFFDALQGGDVAHLRVSKVQNEVLLIDALLHALQRGDVAHLRSPRKQIESVEDNEAAPAKVVA
jgi:hypothetical protein